MDAETQESAKVATEATEPKEAEPASAAGGNSKGKAKSKPNRPLPSDRVAFSKQIDLLRAYGALSTEGADGVALEDAAKVVGLSPSTATLANAFFLDNQLLAKTPERKFLPHADVIAYARAYEWSPETAAEKLGGVMATTWFAKALVPRLRFEAQTADQATAILAEACNAGPGYKGQLRSLLDYLSVAGVVDERDGRYALPAKKEAPETPPEPSVDREKVRGQRTGGAGATGIDGGIQFNVALRVDMREIAGWTPERISAFLAGIAQVLAAKGAMEKE